MFFQPPLYSFVETVILFVYIIVASSGGGNDVHTEFTRTRASHLLEILKKIFDFHEDNFSVLSWLIITNIVFYF